MKESMNGQLLRVLVDENVSYQGKLLHEWIVEKSQELGLAGATVIKGIMGYGGLSEMHTSKLLRLSSDLPVVIEIVDSEEMIQRIVPFIDDAVTEGLVTIEKVKVIKYAKD